MQIIRYPSPDQWASLLQRPVRSLEEIEQVVKPVLLAVKNGGDAALRELTLRFDKVQLEELLVSTAEITAAKNQLSDSLIAAIQQAKQNIEHFHCRQVRPMEEVETMPGVTCWRKSLPIEKVGLYIPGGTAPLFSTVLMLAIPARIAGCKEIVLCSPPDKDGHIHPAILYTAHLCGVTKIIKSGGAQAIAAMAYGTDSVPAVYKVFGPGNQYVTAAKQLIQRDGIAIDMPAGPSEVLVIADHSANAAFVAADLLSQAEHGSDSQVILVTTHAHLLHETTVELERQVTLLPRGNTASAALNNSKMFLVKDLQEAMALSNAYAPEHLILATEEAESLAMKVTNAGSVFIGHLTTEAVGDYASGTNHTLPTNGYARAFSGVSVDSFVKKVTFQHITPEGLRALGPVVSEMAAAEQLEAHRQAVELRLKSL
jgi:histidinol dehydrogenase